MSSPVSRLLAFDCATSVRSVAVWHEGKVLSHLQEQASTGEAQRLIPLIEAAMAQVGMDYRDLDGVAVTLGPGSFTGIRVGLATARGICLAAEKPLIGITTLEALAGDCPDPMILATVDSRRREPFVQIFYRASMTSDLDLFAEPHSLTGPMACEPELLASVVRASAEGPITVIGDCATEIVQLLRDDRIEASFGEPAAPNAASVARIAASRFTAAQKGSTLAVAAPLYLRPADAIPARAGGKLRP
jgi:tRNA threonylcarbamoyladenosine biosynthesis protein TsaB